MIGVLLFLWVLPLVISQNLTCPYSYTLVMDKCLKVYPQGNHSIAESNCRNNGGTLTNIRNSIENRAVSQFAAQNNLNQIWIGLFCFGNDPSSCLYDDESGSLSTYNEFLNQNPLVKTLDDGCVYMITTGSQAGKWISANCNSINIGTVCEVPSSAYETNSVPYCKDFNGFRYCPLSGFTFDQSFNYCNTDFAGTLLSINSKRENDFVIQALYQPYYYFALGAKRLFSGFYIWLDGSAWGTFDNRDPLNNNDQGDYLCIDKRTGFWVSCNGNGATFVCKIPLPQKQITDSSHCNSTELLMAPVKITSYGYPCNKNIQPCTYRIATVGTYRLAISVTDISENNVVHVDDGDGNNLGDAQYHPNYYGNRFISPLNIMTVVTTGGKFSADVVLY